MTDEQPRQLIPRAESHQSLSNNYAASRPLPPRSRNRGVPHTKSSRLPPIAASQDHQPSNDFQTLGHNSQQANDVIGLDTGVDLQRNASTGSESSHDHYLEEIPKEEIEKALQGLNRDDLVIALGRAKVQMDDLDSRLEARILENETLQASSSSLLAQLNLAEAEAQSLHAVVKHREERIDEIMADQEKMESQVYSKMQVIDRLRKQLQESEKSRSDAEKRYMDQTATMDKERQYYADTEALLKSQKSTQASSYDKLLGNYNELLKEHELVTNKLAQLRASGLLSGQAAEADESIGDEDGIGQDAQTKASDDTQEAVDEFEVRGFPKVGGGGSASRVSPRSKANQRSLSEENEVVSLRQELVSIQKSHSSLSDTMHQLQTELRDVKAENVNLRDQNETFMEILQEKTFSGALLNESAILRGIKPSTYSAHGGLLAPYGSDDDVEGEQEEYEADEQESTSINVDEDDVPDTPKARPSTDSKKARASNRRGKRKQSMGFLQPPSDLASELEQTEESFGNDQQESKKCQERRTEKIGAVSDNVAELQNEVRELREANHALTLYISKIIDRIIAREGYENILAVESRGGAKSTRRRASSNANLDGRIGQAADLKTNPAMQPVESKRSVSTGSSTSASSGFFGFGSSNNDVDPSSAKPKSKRSSSIDWRNLPFLGGGGSANDKAAELNPNLRPLTLQAQATSLNRDGSGAARKVRTSEEVEDAVDVAERERIRNQMLREGITPPKNQLVENPNSPHKDRVRTTSLTPGGGFAAFFSRVVSGGSSGLGAVTSPGNSDVQSNASTTPGRPDTLEPLSIVKSGAELPQSSTPNLKEIGKRKEEGVRASQLSGSNGLTELDPQSGNTGRKTNFRKMQTEKNDSVSHGAAEDSGSSMISSGLRSVLTTPSASSNSSFVENSVAGDESYSLPAPPPHGVAAGGARGDQAINNNASPLLGYGNSLPPLPSMTTGNEVPNVYKNGTNAPSDSQPTSSSTGAGLVWKKALKRISLLSGSSAPSFSSPTYTDAGDVSQSPISVASSLPPADY